MEITDKWLQAEWKALRKIYAGVPIKKCPCTTGSAECVCYETGLYIGKLTMLEMCSQRIRRKPHVRRTKNQRSR